MYYRYSIRCPWPCVSGASPLPFVELRHTPVHPLWYRTLPSLAIADALVLSGCGSGETNDIRASPDHMADGPCSLLERVVEKELGLNETKRKETRDCVIRTRRSWRPRPGPGLPRRLPTHTLEPTRLGSFTLLLARRGLDSLQLFTDGFNPVWLKGIHDPQSGFA